MNAIEMLLGQQILPKTFYENGEITIPVVGKRGGVNFASDYSEVSDNNSEAVINRAQDVQDSQEASDRKGLFGVKGTLRDVLGIVGDAFLIQGGNSPMYAPRKRQEQISDAAAGFSVNPREAAERVGYYDVGLARNLLEDAKNAELKTAQQESLAASRDSLATDRSVKQYEKARQMIGGLLNTPGAVANGQISPQALAIAERIAASAGLTLEEFMIAEGMSEEDVRNYATSVLDPYKQERLEDYDRAADQRDFSNQTGRISATRPRAAPRAAQPTRASMAAEAMRVPSDKRTPEQQALIDDFTGRKKKTTERPSSDVRRFRPWSN